MTLRTETDRRHLARAIELAERGRGRVSPNPLVGAVLARDSETIAEGYHSAFGAPHAEVEAIRAAAGASLEDATLYVSLEPCAHHGKTPPCTDAIVRAGIGRVVVASDDPSEHASGRGLGVLRDEGVEVVIADGDLAARARLANQPFRKHARTGRPWVLSKSAMTLDGKVATATGDARQLPLTVVVSRAAPREAADTLEAHGAEVLVAPGENETARVRSALAALGEAGVTSILLEGGPHLAGAFLDAGEIDELRMFLAPLVLGGRTARSALEGEGVETIADAVRALTLECKRVADDVLVTARLKEW
jgi:diaminohydroxyphosphoribosylaminopyrimidine deaminase/5-amino-6-(5-phosphoribosylamino)uracil reductase